MKTAWNLREPLKYEIGNFMAQASDAHKKVAFMSRYVQDLRHICKHIGEVLDDINQVRLPHYWHKSDDFEIKRLWAEDNIRQILTIPGERVGMSITDYVTNDDNYSSIKEIVGAKADVYVICEPTWGTWYRWNSLIIDEFYAGMRAVRASFGNPALYDYSKVVTEYNWDNLTFNYKTKTPVLEIEEDLPSPVTKWGEEISSSKFSVYLNFSLEIPNKPEDEKDAPGCQVITEEIMVETKKIKRHMVCG